MGICALKSADKAAIKRVAWLHRALLPESPIALLGSTFMEKFYYSRLLKSNLIHCDYYEYGGEIVGLIAYTKYSSNLLKLGLRKNFFYLSGLLIFLFLQKPGRFVLTIGVLRLERAITKGSQEREGAILSFGVLSRHRNIGFIRKTGVLIGHELYHHAVQCLKQEGFSKVRMLIEPKNTEALLFYHQYNCNFKTIHAYGKGLIKVTCVI